MRSKRSIDLIAMMRKSARLSGASIRQGRQSWRILAARADGGVDSILREAWRNCGAEEIHSRFFHRQHKDLAQLSKDS